MLERKMKKLLGCFFTIILHVTFVNAEIVEIQNFQDILPYVKSSETLILVDMDDTLTDSTISLGCGAWRKLMREKSEQLQQKEPTSTWNLHDHITFDVASGSPTFDVASGIPVKPVEPIIPEIVLNWQSNGNPVFVLTARGKNKWYSTDIKGVDELTHKQLLQADFDFSKSSVPKEIKFSKYFDRGVIFSSPLKKGIFLKNMLKASAYRPPAIVFIDDKLDQVQSVEKAAQELGIPFVGIWYTRAEKEHEGFDPQVATCQMMYWLDCEQPLSDSEAKRIIQTLPNTLVDIDRVLKIYVGQARRYSDGIKEWAERVGKEGTISTWFSPLYPYDPNWIK